MTRYDMTEKYFNCICDSLKLLSTQRAVYRLYNIKIFGESCIMLEPSRYVDDELVTFFKLKKYLFQGKEEFMVSCVFAKYEMVKDIFSTDMFLRTPDFIVYKEEL